MPPECPFASRARKDQPGSIDLSRWVMTLAEPMFLEGK